MMTNNIVDYCKDNSEMIVGSIALAAKTMPTSMNNPENRFEIDKFFCSVLIDNGFNVKETFLNSYDVTTSLGERISIKIQKDVFQQLKKNGKGDKKPKTLIMKNCLGANRNSGMDFDYLLVIQRGDKVVNNGTVGFAVVNKEKIKDKCFFNGDQLTLKVLNNEYDYISDTKNVEYFSDSEMEKINQHYVNGKKNIYRSIYIFGNKL